MPFNSTVDAFKSLVCRTSGHACSVGPPDDESIGTNRVLVWPWRLEEEPSLQNRPPAPVPGPAPRSLPVRIHCLVLAGDLPTLDGVRSGLQAEPVSGEEGQQIRVYAEAISTETLLGLFSATRVVPRLCLAYVVQSVAA